MAAVELIDKGLDWKLRQIHPNILRAIDRRALRRGAKIIQRAAKQEVPIGDTGNLQKSLKIRSAKRGQDRDLQKIEIYSSLPYANAIHWGWKKRNIEADWFLYGVVAEVSQQVMEVMADEINAELDRLNS